MMSAFLQGDFSAVVIGNYQRPAPLFGKTPLAYLQAHWR